MAFIIVILVVWPIPNLPPHSRWIGKGGCRAPKILCSSPTSTTFYINIIILQAKEWFQRILKASTSNVLNASKHGTEYEQCVFKLVSADGVPSSSLWKEPILSFSKAPLTKPLIALPCGDLHKRATDMFKVGFKWFHWLQWSDCILIFSMFPLIVALSVTCCLFVDRLIFVYFDIFVDAWGWEFVTFHYQLGSHSPGKMAVTMTGCDDDDWCYYYSDCSFSAY